jgi:hypothetical protein
MISIDAIIKARGGYEYLRDHPIRIEVSGFMPLSIEVIGTGPRKGVMIAVHHSKVINGDVCFDPEICFEILGDEWHPLTFEMSGQCYWEVVFTDEATGKLMCRPKLLKDLQSFVRLWNKNLRDQGFVAAAKK